MAKSLEEIRKFNKKRNNEYTVDFNTSIDHNSPVTEAYIKRLAQLNESKPVGTNQQALPVRGSAARDLTSEQRQKLQGLLALGGINTDKRGASAVKSVTDNFMEQFKTDTSPDNYMPSVDPTSTRKYYRASMTDAQRGTNYAGGIEAQSRADIAQGITDKKQQNLTVLRDAYASALTLQDPVLIDKAYKELKAAEAAYKEAESISKPAVEEAKTISKENKAAEFTYNYVTSAQGNADYDTLAEKGKTVDSGLEYSGFEMNNVQNKVRYYENNRQQIIDDLNMNGAINIYERWDYLTEDEKKAYDYMIGSGQYRKAEEFLDGMDRTLQYRQEKQIAENIEKEEGINKHISAFAYGTAGGIGDAIGNIMTPVDRLMGKDVTENVNTTAMQEVFAESEVKGLRFMNSMGQTLGNMLPAMALGAVGGTALSQASMFMNSAGSAYREAKETGARPLECVSYALMSGAAEVFLQNALGGIAQLGSKGNVGRIVSEAIKKVTSKVANQKLITALVGLGDFVGDAVGEGLEEYLQTIITPVLQNQLLDANNEITLTSPEQLEAALSGALFSAVFNGISLAGGANSSVKEARDLEGARIRRESGGVESVIAASLSMDPDSYAYKNAQKLIKKGIDKITDTDLYWQASYVNDAVNTLKKSSTVQNTVELTEQDVNYGKYLIERSANATIENPVQANVNLSLFSKMSNGPITVTTQSGDIKITPQSINGVLNNNSSIEDIAVVRKIDEIAKSANLNPNTGEYEVNVKNGNIVKTVSFTVDNTGTMTNLSIDDEIDKLISNAKYRRDNPVSAEAEVISSAEQNNTAVSEGNSDAISEINTGSPVDVNLNKTMSGIKKKLSDLFVENLLNRFNLDRRKIGDYVYVQRNVFDTLLKEGFFTDKQLRNRVDINEESGMVIETNKSSIDETFNLDNYARLGSFKKKAKLATIIEIPKAIQEGHLITDNTQNSHKGSAVNKNFAYIEYFTNVDGVDIKLKLAIKKSPQKNKFWVHSVYDIENVNGYPASTTSGTEAGYRTIDSGIISQTEQNINTPAENSAENISTNVVPTFETQQQVPASAPTSAVQQIQPAATAPQEASATTDAARAVTPFTARNFTNAEARKSYINGFVKKLNNSLGIHGKVIKEQYEADIEKFADLLQKSSEVPLAEAENLYNSLLMNSSVSSKTERSARKHYNDAVNVLHRQMQRYAKAVERETEQHTAILKANELSVDDVDALYRQHLDLEKNLKKVKSENGLTDIERKIVDDLLSGNRNIESIEGIEASESIKSVYEAEAALRKVEYDIQNYNRSRQARRYLFANKVTSTINKWKDKKLGLFYALETLERIFFDITKDAQLSRELEAAYVTPINDADAAIIRRKNDIVERIEKLKINQSPKYEFENFYGHLINYYTSKSGTALSNAYEKQLAHYYGVKELSELGTRKLSEAEIVQLYGEGIISEADIERIGADPERIKECVAKFKSIYNQLFTEVNRAYISNGYKPMNYIENYFPHYRKETANGLFRRFMRETFGFDGDFNAEWNKLPTDIAGTTFIRKPGRKFFEHELHRKGDITSYDCIEGLKSYLDTALHIIYQTDNIQNLRALEGQIRYVNSEAGIQAQIAQVNNDLSKNEAERQEKLEGLYLQSDTHLSNFVQELRRYTDRLAGKKAFDDRPWEYLLSRPMYKVMNKLSGNTAGNMIGASFSSALNNLTPIALATGDVKTAYLCRGIKDAAKRSAKKDSLMSKSNFYTIRKGAEELSLSIAQRISKEISKPAEFTDLFTVEAVFRGKYYQNIDNGMNEASAIADADRLCGRLFASRNKHVMPTAWHANNPIYKLFTMFQLESNNNIRYIRKDMWRDAEKSTDAIAWGLVKILISSWLANKATKLLLGRSILFDPIGILECAIYEYADTDKSFGEATGNVLDEIADQLPWASIFSGGGRVPVTSMLPEWDDISPLIDSVGAVFTGDATKNDFTDIGSDIVVPSLYAVNPFGGLGQVRKTIQGIKTVSDGGEIGYDAKGDPYYKYVVDNDTLRSSIGNYLQAGIFGKSALSEAQDYYDGNTGKLSPEQTAALQRLKEIGAGTYKVSQVMQTVNQTDASRNTEGEIIDSRAENVINYVKDTDLKEREKEEVIYSSGVLSDEVIEDLHSAEEYDIPAMTFYNVYLAKLNAESDKDVNGKTVANSKSIYIREAIDDVSGLTDEQRMYLYELMGVNKTVANASDVKLQMIYGNMLRQKEEAERRKSVGLLN